MLDASSSDGTDNILPAIIRSPDIWFEDGNVILQTEGVHFKVYRGTLAANSTVFRDMFEISLPGNSTLEGCPVIPLYDSPKDLTHFLRAIHFLGHCKPTCTREGFPQLVALLRLGTKYQVQFMRQAALDELHAVYPASFEKWLKRKVIKKDTFVERAMWVVQLARETHAVSLLPATLYVCSNMPDINYILDGVTAADGKHIELDWPDKRACIRGREKLGQMVRTELFKFVSPLSVPNPECRTPERCRVGGAKLAKGLEQLYALAVEASWALRLSSPIAWDLYAKDVCSSCMQLAKAHYNAEQARIWDLLPEIFCLPSWEELKRQDDIEREGEENI